MRHAPSASIAPSALALLLTACGGAPARTATPEPRAHGHHAHGHHAHGHHRFDDPARWSRVFDDPARDAWQRPDEVVALLDAPAGATVVDLGAGTGYFLARLARAVGGAGRVLALDVEPRLVEWMTRRAAEASLANVEARVVRPDDPGLAPASVDRVLVVDTWHHLEDRVAYARRLARALRPGGAVLVVDFTREAPEGPPPAMRLAPDAVVAELRAAGLEADVVEETLPRQYAVRGRAPAAGP